MPTIYAAVKAIIQKGDKILILKQELKNSSVWDLPGGRVDYGESPYDTLIREIKEETGLEAKIKKPLGMFWFFRQDKAQVICNTFLCSIQNTNVDLSQNSTNEKISEYQWVTIKEFLTEKYVVSHQSLKNLITKI